MALNPVEVDRSKQSDLLKLVLCLLHAVVTFDQIDANRSIRQGRKDHFRIDGCDIWFAHGVRRICEEKALFQKKMQTLCQEIVTSGMTLLPLLFGTTKNRKARVPLLHAT